MEEQAGRVPPNDLDAEAAVLSAAICDGTGDVLDRVLPIVTSDDFYSDAHRKIFSALVALRSTGQPIDILMLRANLEDRGELSRVGGVTYLAEIIDAVPAISNVERYAERIVEKRKMRTVISTAREIAAKGYLHAGTASEFVDGAEAAFARINEEATTDGLASMMSSCTEAAGRMERVKKGETSGLRSGLTALDEITSGWEDGNLIIVGGRPGMGKTGLAGKFAVSAAQQQVDGVPQACVFFSLEMPRWQLALRAACADSCIDQKLARQNALESKDQTRLQYSFNKLGKLPLWIDETSPMTVTQMQAKVRRLQGMCARGNMRLGLVVIDYLQLLTPSMVTNQSSRRELVDQVARDLKNAALRLGLPIIALAQLNRATEETKGKRPNLANLREAGEIEQAADTVVFVYRKDYYGAKDNKQQRWPTFRNVPVEEGGRPIALPAELIVGKQRNGPVGTAKVAFRGPYVRFDNRADAFDDIDESYWDDEDDEE